MRGLLELPPELAPVMDALPDLLARVQGVFDQQLAHELPPVQQLIAHVERYRGKMLRPLLVLVSGMAAHKDAALRPPGELISHAHLVVGAVLEMVHMATLVHDDVLDDAETRRRGPTINALHGNEAAVLLGDLLLASAYHLCSTLPTSDAALAVARASVVTASGELLQLHHRGNYSLDEATYVEIIARKTGDLIATAARLGAVLSTPNAGVHSALEAFGRGVGIAFQVQDDLLDLTGEERTVGKSVGKDLEKAKLTLPFIHHLAHARPLTRGRTLLILDAAGLDATSPDEAGPNNPGIEHRGHRSPRDTHNTRDTREELLSLLRETDSLAYARAFAQRHVAQAKLALATLPPSPAQRTLLHLADGVIDRAF